MSSHKEIDRETTTILLGVGTGILIGGGISTPLTPFIGSVLIMIGLAYNLYQRMKAEQKTTNQNTT